MTFKIIVRSFLIASFWLVMCGIMSAIIFLFLAQTALCLKHDCTSRKEDALQLIKEIYREVLELGYRQDEQFIKREFFMNLDDNEENKEEHVVIFSRHLDGEEKMIIQVTYFQPISKNRLVKQAINSMEILCSLKKGKIAIEECDYAQEDIQLLLPKILEGIKIKKKMLQLIKS